MCNPELVHFEGTADVLRAMFIGHGRALEILPKEFRSKGSGADVRERDISDSTHW